MKKKATVLPGARIAMKNLGDNLIIEIARNNRKPFKDRIIIVQLVKHQLQALERHGIADAWFVKSDGRRKMIG